MAGNRKVEARRWYQQAAYDLGACRWNIQGEFYDTACFLCQQSAEKAVKSLLFYLGARGKALLTHSIVNMIRHCEKSIPPMAALLEEARRLDLHYVPSRYPNGLPSGFPHQFYGRQTAEDALLAAEKIVSAVAEQYRLRSEDDILAEEPPES